MCRGICSTGDGPVGFTVTTKQIAEVKRIFNRLFGLLERRALRAAHLVIHFSKFFEIVRFPMIKDLDSVKISASFCRDRTHLFIVSDHGYLCKTVASADSRGLDRSRVVALRQNDVLNVSCGTPANLFEYHKLRVNFPPAPNLLNR